MCGEGVCAQDRAQKETTGVWESGIYVVFRTGCGHGWGDSSQVCCGKQASLVQEVSFQEKRPKRVNQQQLRIGMITVCMLFLIKDINRNFENNCCAFNNYWGRFSLLSRYLPCGSSYEVIDH